MMNQLNNLTKRFGAKTRPATTDAIRTLEEKLGFALAPDYIDFLSCFGVIVHGSTETYGLGVPETYYLHVLKSYEDLSRDPKYPPQNVPLIDIGDGHYYLYDNAKQHAVLWATPNGGVVKTIDGDLESVLCYAVFGTDNTAR